MYDARSYVHATTLYVYNMYVCVYVVSAFGISRRDFDVISVT